MFSQMPLQFRGWQEGISTFPSVYIGDWVRWLHGGNYSFLLEALGKT